MDKRTTMFRGIARKKVETKEIVDHQKSGWLLHDDLGKDWQNRLKERKTLTASVRLKPDLPKRSASTTTATAATSPR